MNVLEPLSRAAFATCSSRKSALADSVLAVRALISLCSPCSDFILCGSLPANDLLDGLNDGFIFLESIVEIRGDTNGTRPAVHNDSPFGQRVDYRLRVIEVQQ